MPGLFATEKESFCTCARWRARRRRSASGRGADLAAFDRIEEVDVLEEPIVRDASVVALEPFDTKWVKLVRRR